MRMLTVIALLTLAACDGEDKKDPDAAPTFSEIRDDILMPSCGLSSCHGATPPAGDLYIGADMGIGELVNVASVDDPNQIRVVPGDADNSYLIKKMERAPDIYGDPMPPPFGAGPEDVDPIRAWIEAGAKDN